MTPRSSPAPNTKSDTQWLHDLGYPTGFQSFKLDYGFSPDDAQDHLDALTLFHQFRTEQQEIDSHTYTRTNVSVYAFGESTDEAEE
ncbi:uncharacterized protein EAF02_009577 [Botrytis sinoallii]|uniref:uncharacterized protein n=1 Tax=Botrytis sinoallii TaxID=1463999 RepID=UPI0019007669|nr:uncharacterized protein EAF02_009577 [Botrytis sinoallii]KAF7868841.1 hypothetical protein EAF02_009577 [Botrytis sinoallii]